MTGPSPVDGLLALARAERAGRAAEERRDQRAAAARRLVAEERRVEAERAAAQARREAFEQSHRAAGGDALAFLEGAGRDGVLGPLAPALSVEPGYEAAVAAALGPDADAIVVAGPAVATGGARLLRDAGSGRAILLHPPPPAPPGVGPRVDPRVDQPTDLHVGPRTGRVADGREGGSPFSTGGVPGTNGAPLLLDRVATNGFAGDVARALRADRRARARGCGRPTARPIRRCS